MNSTSQNNKIESDSIYADTLKSNNDKLKDSMSFSETDNQFFDSLYQKPKITKDLSIVSNMPAATYNGQYVLVSISDYSCCYDTGVFLDLYDMAKNKKIQRIQNGAGEDDEWENASIDSVRIRAKKIINSRNYYTMLPIAKDNRKLIKKSNKTEWSIEFDYKNKIYKSNTFKLERIAYATSECCTGGLIEDDYDCKISPSIMNVWIDASEKMILLEYGIVHDFDGCDRGPFFKTVDLIGNE